MGCDRTNPETQQTLVSLSTTIAYAAFTGWGPAIGNTGIKATLKNRAVQGFFESQVAVQTAAVRIDNPDAWQLLDSAQVGAGEKCSSVDVTSYTDDKAWVRYGVGYKVQNAQSGLASSDVAFQPSLVQCGQIVGAKTLDLVATSSTDGFVALTGWIPRTMADKVMAAIVFRSLAGNFRWKLTKRYATTSKEDPGAWATDFEASYRTAAGESNSGEITVGSASDMWVQFGVQFSSSSGTGSASLDIAIGVRRS